MRSVAIRRRVGVAVMLLLVMTQSLPGIVQAQAAKAVPGDLAIVVHPSTPVSGLSFAELRQVFQGDRQYWNKDVPIVLLIRAPTSAERDAVLKTLYQMSEPQFKQFWIAKIFRAETATPPKIVFSSDSTNQLVEAVPGAIAFMLAKDVRPGVKVLRIDGRLPGDSGYRLHQR